MRLRMYIRHFAHHSGTQLCDMVGYPVMTRPCQDRWALALIEAYSMPAGQMRGPGGCFPMGHAESSSREFLFMDGISYAQTGGF